MKHIFFLGLLFVVSTCAHSSEFFDEVKEDAISPFNTKALNVLEVGGGLTLVAFVFEENLKDKLQDDVSSDRPLSRSSKIGDILGRAWPNIAYALAMGTSYLISDDQKYLDRTILMTKATLYSGAMTDILKRVIREKRPNGGAYSFPSGHATSVFAFSSVVMMEHPLPYGIAANAMAAFVGFSRINDNAHFLQDVLAGATIGTMYGVGVYYAQKNREEKKSENQTVTMIYPITNGLAGNMAISF